jgi:hypothetical protein
LGHCGPAGGQPRCRSALARKRTHLNDQAAVRLSRKLGDCALKINSVAKRNLDCLES